MLKVAFLVLLLSSVCSAFSQYKCIENGAVSYQDLPCTGSGGRIDIRPSSGNSTAGKAIDNTIKKSEPGLSSTDMNAAYATGTPRIGMTREQLDLVMGQPSFVNPSNYGGVQQDQIGYNRGKDVWYVYTKSGIVTSIQLRPDVSGSAGAGSGVACPTGHEIRDAITSASSIIISEAERTARWKIIQDMQACGKQKK
jgi:hypothetical protein